jgi:predicted dienelactone hydrolase
MKQLQTAFKFLTVIALLALAVGCATETQNKQNMAIAAGFKIITPAKPDQIALLQSLPADKVTPVNYHGKTFYVLPDAKNNQAYVGGTEQYQAYQQLRLAQHLSNQNLEAAQMNSMNSMNWGAWGGWGGVGFYGRGWR